MEFVGNFINKLKLPKALAAVVLKSEDDCKEYFKKFHNRSKNRTEDLYSYRSYKIKRDNVSFGEFMTSIEEVGLGETVKDVMLQPFDTYDSTRMTEAVLNGKISYFEVFMSFKCNENQNIIKILS